MKYTAILIAAGIVLAGCSAPAAAPSPSAPTSATASAPESPSPSPSATRDYNNLPVGDHVTLTKDDAEMGTLTMLEGKYTSSPYRDRPLYAAKVKACATKQNMTVTSDGWLVETADGDQFNAADDQGKGDPEPMYPLFDRTVNKGRCVQGWIPFEIKKGTKVSHVGFLVSDEITVYWRV